MLHQTYVRVGRERNITRHSLIYVELTRTIKRFFYVGDPHIGRYTATKLCDPEHNVGVRKMSITQFRADLARSINRRRLYARINALPNSTIREELLAIAQRHDENQ